MNNKIELISRGKAAQYSYFVHLLAFPKLHKELIYFTEDVDIARVEIDYLNNNL